MVWEKNKGDYGFKDAVDMTGHDTTKLNKQMKYVEKITITKNEIVITLQVGTEVTQKIFSELNCR